MLIPSADSVVSMCLVKTGGGGYEVISGVCDCVWHLAALGGRRGLRVAGAPRSSERLGKTTAGLVGE